MDTRKSGRRRFLKDAAALAGLAAVGGASIPTASGHGHDEAVPDAVEQFLADGRLIPYGTRSRFETAGRAFSANQTVNPGYWMTPLQDSLGIITSSSLHFVNPSSSIPEIDPGKHRFLIHGMVDRPRIYTMAELRRLPSVSRIYFLECAGDSGRAAWNDAKTIQDTHGRVSCAEWTGVPLSLLLKEAGVKEGAKWVISEGADAVMRRSDLPLERAMDDVLLVYGQNGEPLRPEQGYPLRMLIPGSGGGNNIKWLRRLQVTDQPHRPLAASSESGTLAMPVKSVITFPSGGHQLSDHGFYEITGVAWSSNGAIRKVEVSTDGGRTWKDAPLQEPVLRIAFTRFRLGWNWKGEEAVLLSRATDEQGDVQPSVAELSKIKGVSLDFWKSNNGLGNAIQPWKVTREGSVLNGYV